MKEKFNPDIHLQHLIPDSDMTYSFLDQDLEEDYFWENYAMDYISQPELIEDVEKSFSGFKEYLEENKNRESYMTEYPISWNHLDFALVVFQKKRLEQGKLLDNPRFRPALLISQDKRKGEQYYVEYPTKLTPEWSFITIKDNGYTEEWTDFTDVCADKEEIIDKVYDYFKYLTANERHYFEPLCQEDLSRFGWYDTDVNDTGASISGAWWVPAYKSPGVSGDDPVFAFTRKSLMELNFHWGEEGMGSTGNPFIFEAHWTTEPIFNEKIYKKMILVPDAGRRQHEDIKDEIEKYLSGKEDNDSKIEFYEFEQDDATGLYVFPIPWNWTEPDEIDARQKELILLEEEGMEL